MGEKLEAALAEAAGIEANPDRIVRSDTVVFKRCGACAHGCVDGSSCDRG